ncbi:hydroxylase [Sphaerisporangium rufum]|uniref:Hydroxylase n=1 Tax=Sphaerisporangium rufum TaxID=1381558 RepID=A0A919R3Y5_9ACTN|nr:VOC family protein [Sphaerisporangium rufum]GII79254.1 hydroxylase [Sphaerisporangium rufum]
MPARTGHRPGVPCWTDLASPDVAASVAFYERLFGWRAEFDPRPEAGGYGLFRLRDKPVAGIGAIFGTPAAAGWNTYLATEDAETIAGLVKEAGGLVRTGPMQVFDDGTMAVFEDPAGAVFMVWQAGRHFGAQLVDEPVAPGRFELLTRDPAGAEAFYPAVFGWSGRGTTEPARADRADRAAGWSLDGQAVAGLGPADGVLPAGESARWLVHFTVADCDATAAAAERAGATVLRAPQDRGGDRRAVLADPLGAAFGLLAH